MPITTPLYRHWLTALWTLDFNFSLTAFAPYKYAFAYSIRQYFGKLFAAIRAFHPLFIFHSPSDKLEIKSCSFSSSVLLSGSA